MMARMADPHILLTVLAGRWPEYRRERGLPRGCLARPADSTQP